MAVQPPLKFSTSYYIAHATSTIPDYYNPRSSTKEAAIFISFSKSCFRLPRLSSHSSQRSEDSETDAADIPNTPSKVMIGSHWPFFHHIASSRRLELSSSSRKLSQKNPPAEISSDSSESVPEVDGETQIKWDSVGSFDASHDDLLSTLSNKFEVKASEDGGGDTKCDSFGEVSWGLLSPSLVPSSLNGILEINAGSGDDGEENKLDLFNPSSGLGQDPHNNFVEIKQYTQNSSKNDRISFALNHSNGFDLLLDKWRKIIGSSGGQLPWISSEGAKRKSVVLLTSQMILKKYRKKKRASVSTTNTDEDERQFWSKPILKGKKCRELGTEDFRYSNDGAVAAQVAVIVAEDDSMEVKV